MNNSLRERLLQINVQLIEEADSVRSTRFETGIPDDHDYVDLHALHKWWGKVKSFGHQLGAAARPWQDTFDMRLEQNKFAIVERIRGTLEAIRHELENDHLNSFTRLVKAETLADLLDQAQHLFAAGYFLAAGVIGRAILEEHLRSTCNTIGCAPSKDKPTINDFNQSLYGKDHYSKTKMKHIDTLAAIGNDAAHNKSGLDAADVQRLLRDLPEVIESTGV